MNEHENSPNKDIFPGYEITRPIGRGGFGTVFECKELQPPHRTLAVKYLRAGVDTDDVLRRFESEQETLAALRHPNIAAFISSGQSTEGRPFFVLEYVEGKPLNHFLESKSLSSTDKLSLFRKICNGISNAHTRGVIHRDIKPTNILVDENSASLEPKIIDFGLAKATQKDAVLHTQHTSAELVLGTWDYMSPEQTKGLEYEVDTRSDIYSLGCILFYILEGKTVFNQLSKEPISEIIRIICEENPAYSKHSNSRIDKTKQKKDALETELHWITLKCLRKNPANRYGTVEQLIQDLDRLTNGDPIEARPPSTIYRWSKYTKKYKTTIGLAFVFVASLLSLTFWALEEREISRTAQIEAENQKRQAQKAEKESLEKARIAKEKEQEANQLKELASLSEQEAIRQAKIAEKNEQAAIRAKEAEKTIRLEAEKLNENLNSKVKSLENMSTFFADLIENLEPETLEAEFKNQLLNSKAFTETAKLYGDEKFQKNFINAMNTMNLKQIFSETTKIAVMDPVVEEMELFSLDFKNQTNVLQAIADAYNSTQNYGKALEYYNRVLSILKLSDPPPYNDIYYILSQISWCHIKLDNYTEATAVAQQLVKLSEKAPPHYFELRLDAKSNLATVLQFSGQYKKALEILEPHLKLRATAYTTTRWEHLKIDYMSDLAKALDCAGELQDFKKGDEYQDQIKALLNTIPNDHFIRPNCELAVEQYRFIKAKDLGDLDIQGEWLGRWAAENLKESLGEDLNLQVLINFATEKLESDPETAINVSRYGIQKYFENPQYDEPTLKNIDNLFYIYCSGAIKQKNTEKYNSILARYFEFLEIQKEHDPIGYMGSFESLLINQTANFKDTKLSREFGSAEINETIQWISEQNSISVSDKNNFYSTLLMLEKRHTDLINKEYVLNLMSEADSDQTQTTNLMDLNSLSVLTAYSPDLAVKYLGDLKTGRFAKQIDMPSYQKALILISKAMILTHCYSDHESHKSALSYLNETTEQYGEVLLSNTLYNYFTQQLILINSTIIDDPRIAYEAYKRLKSLTNSADLRLKVASQVVIDATLECYFYELLNLSERISFETIQVFFDENYDQITRLSFGSKNPLVSRSKILLLLQKANSDLFFENYKTYHELYFRNQIDYINTLISDPDSLIRSEMNYALGLIKEIFNKNLTGAQKEELKQLFKELIAHTPQNNRSLTFNTNTFPLLFYDVITNYSGDSNSAFVSETFNAIEQDISNRVLQDKSTSMVIATLVACLGLNEFDSEMYPRLSEITESFTLTLDPLLNVNTSFLDIRPKFRSRVFYNLSRIASYSKLYDHSFRYIKTARSLLTLPDLTEKDFKSEFGPNASSLEFSIDLLEISLFLNTGDLDQASKSCCELLKRFEEFDQLYGFRFSNNTGDSWDYYKRNIYAHLFSLSATCAYFNDDFHLSALLFRRSNDHLLTDENLLFGNHVLQFNLAYLLAGLQKAGLYNLYWSLRMELELRSIQTPYWSNYTSNIPKKPATIYQGFPPN